MYRYASDRFVDDQRWIADSIGCRCENGGLLVTSLPLVQFQEVPYVMDSRRFRFHAQCVLCRRQGMVPFEESHLPEVDYDSAEELMAVVTDFFLVEKGCEHRDFWCLSHGLVNDERFPYKTPTANPRLHMACCLKCRRRGIIQLPIGLSDMINERIE